MRLGTIIPVKRLSASKVRLAPFLSLEERRGLTLKMLSHVVRTSTKSTGEVLVIGSDVEVREICLKYGALFVRDKALSLNSAIAQAINRGVRRGLEAVLIVAADLPLLSHYELERLIDNMEDNEVMICPSKDCGTNALFLRPPKVMLVRFGPNSFSRHLSTVMNGGRKFRIFWSPGLSFDIDTPADLKILDYPKIRIISGTN